MNQNSLYAVRHAVVQHCGHRPVLPSPRADGLRAYSGGPIGYIDVDNDSLDDLVLFDQGDGVNILYQTASDSPCALRSGGAANQWGACIGDMNNDGWTPRRWLRRCALHGHRSGRQLRTE